MARISIRILDVADSVNRCGDADKRAVDDVVTLPTTHSMPDARVHRRRPENGFERGSNAPEAGIPRI